MTSLLNVFRPLGFLFSFEYRYEKDDMFFQTSVLEAAELTSTELCKKKPQQNKCTLRQISRMKNSSPSC